MYNLSDKIAALTPKGTTVELDSVLVSITQQLELAEKFLSGKNLPLAACLRLWVAFFHALRTKHSAEDIKRLFTTLLTGLRSETDRLLTSVANANIQAKALNDEKLRLETALQLRQDEKFGLETALEARQVELARLQTLFDELTIAQKQNQGSDLQTQIQPLLAVADTEMAYLDLLLTSVGDFKSRLAEGVGQLARILPQSADADKPMAVAVTDVRPEISRRNAWLADAQEIITTLGEEREDMNKSLDALRDTVRFGGGNDRDLVRMERQLAKLTVRIDGLLATEQEVQQQIRTLQTYQRAAEVMQTGLSGELIGKNLPELPEASTISAPMPMEQPSTIEIGSKNERYAQLISIGKANDITPEAVFIISLYECLGTATKAAAGMVKASDEIGLNARFGLPPGNKEIFGSFRTPKQVEDEYLKYMGKLNGGIFKRTSRVLGWNVRQLFTPEEVEAFVALIATRVIEK